MKIPLLPVCLIALTPAAPLRADLGGWAAAVDSGATPPVVTYSMDISGPAISGFAPILLDVGALEGARSFEFIVNAGDAGSSSALIGLAGVQGLKFEQNFETGHIGITDYGIADHDSPVNCPVYRDTQIVFTSDGADTRLYVNGVEVHQFAGVPLNVSGLQSLGGVSDGFGGGDFDRLDGHILGFASYNSELSAAEVAAHHAAFEAGSTPVSLASWRNRVASGSVVPSQTVFRPVSGMAPVLTDVGELSGPMTFEFLVNSGETGESQALLGRAGAQGLKFEQWQNSGLVGLTDFGVADHSSGLLSPYQTLSQIVYVSDGAGTDLYLNGTWTDRIEGAPVTLSGFTALGAAGAITGLDGITTYRDPLDGQVLRFASYDEVLTEAEVTARFEAFQLDGGAQSFLAWQTEVNSGSPATVILEPVSGADQRSVDVGALSGGRTFEFIVNAGLGGGSGSLLGGNSQALKFEQWQDTGTIGLTAYGVADHNSFVLAPELVDTHIVFSSDGTDTTLYVDGVAQYIFSGVALTGTGQQGLATAAVLPVLGATYSDRLDGHILGFASYPAALEPAEIAAHFAALTSGVPVAPGPFEITAFSRNPDTGAITLTWSSDDDAVYRIEYSETPAAFLEIAVDGIAATIGGSTSRTFPPPVTSDRLFFRIVRL